MTKALLILKSYFPTRLPVGMAEFAAWSTDVITLVGPIADTNSLKFALATQIMHADASKSSLPMQYFVNRIRKTAANQVAGQVFQDIKTAQIEAQKKAAESVTPQTPEVTVPLGVTPNATEVP